MGSVTSPLLLNASAVFVHNSPIGQIVRFSDANLNPRTLVPYAIDSIRFYIDRAKGGAVNETASGPDGGMFGVMINCGPWALTDNFVPIENLAPVRQSVTESGGFYHWKFKNRMYVPAGRALTVQAQLLTALGGASNDFTIHVAASGVVFDRRASIPTATFVPFAANWDTRFAGVLNNDPISLRNPLAASVTTELMIGRLHGTDAETGLIQVYRADGSAISDEPVQFRDLFPLESRGLAFDDEIPAGQKLTVRLTPSSGGTAANWTSISYLGDRRERI